MNKPEHQTIIQAITQPGNSACMRMAPRGLVPDYLTILRSAFHSPWAHRVHKCQAVKSHKQPDFFLAILVCMNCGENEVHVYINTTCQVQKIVLYKKCVLS